MGEEEGIRFFGLFVSVRFGVLCLSTQSTKTANKQTKNKEEARTFIHIVGAIGFPKLAN